MANPPTSVFLGSSKFQTGGMSLTLPKRIATITLLFIVCSFPSFVETQYLSDVVEENLFPNCDFLHCAQDGRCLPVLDDNFQPLRKECEGVCIPLEQLCRESCGPGQCLVRGRCQTCRNTLCSYPDFCNRDFECLETVHLYEHANSTSVKSCNGECIPYDEVCEEECGLAWQCVQGGACVSIHQGGLPVLQSCGGQCLPVAQPCTEGWALESSRSMDLSARCVEGHCEDEGSCLPLLEDGVVVRWECEGLCQVLETPCRGGCQGGGRCLSQGVCITLQVDMGECEGVCQPPGLPCHGSCMAAQCLAGSECLSLAEDGQVVRGSCRGNCQDRSQPCEGECPAEMCLEGGLCLELWDPQFQPLRNDCSGRCAPLDSMC